MPSYPNPFRTTTAQAPQDMLLLLTSIRFELFQGWLLLFATPTPTAATKAARSRSGDSHSPLAWVVLLSGPRGCPPAEEHGGVKLGQAAQGCSK